MYLLSVSENILLFVSGFGMLQGILLAMILYFHPRTDKSVTTYLALFLLCVSIPILMPIGLKLFSWHVIIFIEPFTVLIGPLLYFYVRSFKETINWRKAWMHFIPFVLFVGYSFIVYDQLGSKHVPSTIVPKSVTSNPLSYVAVSLRLAHRVVYYFIALRTLNSYQQSIRHLYSETSRISLRWVRWLINGYLFIVICTIVFYMMMVKFPENFSLWVLITGGIVSVYIYIAALKGITQPTLWQIKPGIDKQKVEAQLEHAKKLEEQQHNGEQQAFRKTGLSGSRIDEIVGKIVAVIENEKLYQETELTLQDLADKLQYPSYQVSQAINDGMKKNFYDLINSYRVEEAKRLLLDPDSKNYTILSVGFEAGFNSKTTFNTVFKKFTGQTPSDFRQKQKAMVEEF